MNNLELEHGLYRIAKSDFNFACRCYNENYYPYAIYSLQQAIEKLSKAWGLKTDVITKDELKRKVSHQSEKIFKQAIKAPHENLKEILSSEQPPFIKIHGIDNQAIDIEKEGQKLEQGMQKIQHINSKQLKHASVSFILKMVNPLKPLNDIELPLTDNRFLDYLSNFKIQVGTEIIVNDFDWKSFFLENSDQIKTVINEACKQAYISISLFQLGLLFSAHNISTRYPSECCGEIPEDAYNSEHPLVITFEKLATIFRHTLGYYEHLFK